MGQLDWLSIAAAAVVPVVVISADGLLCLALYNRLAAVVSRLRVFERERIETLTAVAAHRGSGAPSPERVRHEKVLESLNLQIAAVTSRALLLQRALVCLLLAASTMLVCSLFSALAKVVPPLGVIGLGCYVLGVLWMLGGLVFALREMLSALEPVRLEARVVDDLAEALALRGEDPAA